MSKTDTKTSGLTRRQALTGAAATVAAAKAAFPAGAHAAGAGPEIARARLGFIALTRAHLQDSVMEIHAALNNTVLMIIHDVDEATLLSDRIVMMTNGPRACVGQVLDVPLARPRDRPAVAGHPTYVHARAAGIEFLHARRAA